ncbi:hypothetical protein [Mammaliicoccus sciuri]|uniref:hypothetical protein n=1 Tax=Mammaliicoccus sciuri TaxID=1296 RepID=UPI0034DD5BCC
MTNGHIKVGDIREYYHDHWSSDWNGDEVGYDDISVVGLYVVKDSPDIHYYVNTETGEVLEVWYSEDY